MRKGRIAAGAVIVIVIAGLLFLAFRIGVWVERRTPGKEVMSLDRYYEIEEDEIVVILKDQPYEKTARMVDGQLYLDFDTAQQLFLKRLYLDEQEGVVVFTTPTEVFRYPIGENSYTINDESKERDFPMAVRLSGGVYIALPYLQEEVEFQADYTPDPGRLVLFTDSGDYTFREVKKATQVRTEANVKSEILKELAEGERLWIVRTQTEDEAADTGFVKVLTEDGVLGWVQEKRLSEEQNEQKRFEERQEEYTSIRMDEPVVLVWHQVFNQTANSYLEDKLKGADGVNVVSPTWFSVEETNGKLSTLANEEYVRLAHEKGLQVWPLVNDFNQNVDFGELFARTTYRRNLINNLLYFVRTFDLDGINIDFERITSDNSKDYIQFLRELSVSCRREGIVLSVDNYVPMAHTAFYDRAEQGVLADYVMVMAYDEHYAGSETAGSVSSLSWVETGITKTMEEVPAEKLVVGLPLYTRIWKERKNDGGQISLSSEACSMNAAKNLFESKEVTPVWDDETGQYYGDYTEDGVTYRIWMEEERSIAAKLEVVEEYAPAGTAFWKLGLEREEVWEKVSEWKSRQ